ncbi:MAG: S8 family peptidase [Pseudomonadota bacterium]
MGFKNRVLRNAAALIAGFAVFATAGCDQRPERVERAQTAIGAAIDQALGNGPPPNPMADVAVEDRAYAARTAPLQTVQPDYVPVSRFAIGSIIAKPKDLPPLPSPEQALMMQAPEIADEISLEVNTRAMPVEPIEDVEAIEAPETSTRALQAKTVADEAVKESQSELRSLRQRLERRRQDVLERSGGLPDLPLDDAALPGHRLKLAKRAIRQPETVERQVSARSKMLDVMAQYGLSGQVELNRTGEMVIQIGDEGADPTQFATGELQTPFPAIAINRPDNCPDRPDREALRRDKVLATACMLKQLRASGDYEYVEKDFIFDHQFVRRPEDVPVVTAVTPNDPLWVLQWHFQNNGTGALETPGSASFEDFWTRQRTQGSRDVVVAVVDTGLDLDHPDIETSINLAPGWDMVSDPRIGNDGDGRDPDPDDPGDLCDPNDPFAEDSFHGTHVAGTIGANASNNASGVAGGAWQVTVVPVRALGKCGGRLTDINDAIRWAGGLVPAFDAAGNEVWNENPADIINLSIGLFEFCPASLQDAITAVTERGVVVVSAAGNARVPTEFYAPAGCQNVVTVAAGDARGQITPYSNYGDEVDILAPGGDLTRDDNADGRPDGVLSTKRANGCADPVTGISVESCNYAFEQGTSMAAPHVSAALALLKSRDPDLIGTELRDALLANVDARTPAQCAGSCSIYQGFDEIPGQPGQCARPCGNGLLNLANVPDNNGGGSND